MTVQSLDVESDYFGVNCAFYCPLFPVLSPVLRRAVHVFCWLRGRVEVWLLRGELSVSCFFSEDSFVVIIVDE